MRSKQTLEHDQRRIADDSPGLQEIDEAAYRGGLQIQVRSTLCDGGEARWRTRVLYVGHEVQKEEIHVLDLVVPLADRVFRGHECGDVSAHAEAAFVRIAGDEGHQLRPHRAIDLDLLVT